MACFSWLHLTDLHCGQQEHSWLLPGVQDIFFEDIEKLYQKCGPWDLVLFTGDLTQKGTTEDFQAAQVFLEQLWKCFETFDTPLPTLLAVPGNHDLVRPTPEEKEDPSFILLQQWEAPPIVQQHFWEKPNSPYRQIVDKAFATYTDWWHNQRYTPKNINHGLLPGDFSVSIAKEDAQLGIVGLNTSFLQLTEDDYNGKLALHPRQFHSACDGDGPAWAKKHHVCLLLTHHPPTWLNETSRQHLNAEITARGRFVAQLCGHAHEAESWEIIEGGTEPRRIWQGRSLFGLEHFGPNNEDQRLHGYSAGRIELRKEKKGILRFWPRKDERQGQQRNIVPDFSQNLTDDQYTIPREFDLLQAYTLTSEPQESAKQFGKKMSGEKRARPLPDSDESVIDPRALEAYLYRLFQDASPVNLSGIQHGCGEETDTRLNLWEVYTALLTQRVEQEERLLKARPDRESDESHYESAVALLNKHDRLVLLGDAGSGKSTFVNFVVLCLTGEGLHNTKANLENLRTPLPDDDGKRTDQQQPWDHGALMPIKIVLRDFAASELPLPTNMTPAQYLLDVLERTLTEHDMAACLPVLRQYLEQGQALLLFDGLDEVPEPGNFRQQVFEMIEDCARCFNKCRILVTSRTYAYQHQLPKFADAVLLPFADGQIRWFAQRWYEHVAQMQRNQDATQRAAALQDEIFSDARIFDMARRPLLLTMIAALHQWRGRIPPNQERLYRDATDLLLWRWEQGKFGVDNQGNPYKEQSLSEVLKLGQAGPDLLHEALRELAFCAHTQEPLTRTQETADIAEDDLIRRLKKIRPQEDINDRKLARYLRERAGILLLRGEHYTFPHRSFQEYLAACYLYHSQEEERFPENIVNLVRHEPERWREVFFLTVQMGNPADKWRIVELLCPLEPDSPEAGQSDAWAWGAWFAAHVLAQHIGLERVKFQNDVDRKEKVQRWLKTILTEQQPQQPLPALERARAGDLLAAFGDDRPGVGLREGGLPDIVWCEVPEGTFKMGSDPKKDTEAYDDEQPQHEVFVSAFEISRYPITNVQYQAFVEDDGYTEKWKQYWTSEGWQWREQNNITEPDWAGGVFDLPNHPVVEVSWYEADAFCRWLTIRLREKGELAENQIIRLPSEAEWEKAARGEDGRIYPWGKSITLELANYSDTKLGATSAVDCFPRGASPYGCEDMAGNVWEWCQDWFQSGYYAESPERNPQGPDSGEELLGGGPGRVGRGGSWGDSAGRVRCAYRDRHWPHRRFGNIGFRPVRIYL